MFVYLDNSATTKPYDEVVKEMSEVMSSCFGNPSSLHRMGFQAEKTVKASRLKIAEALGADPGEVYFTGSGTEGDNIAVLGGARALKRKGKKIITSAVEHPAVLETFKALEGEGFKAVYLETDGYGYVNMDQLKSELDDDTVLVSLMHVNNELGTIQPVEDAGRLVKALDKTLFHVDGVQSFGKLRMKSAVSAADLLSVSAHKIHGPKGMGALYIKKGVNIKSPVTGGGQEKNIRSGTENVPGISGFGKAAELAYKDFDRTIENMRNVRKYLLEGIKSEIKDIRINSYEDERCAASVLNVSFLGVRGEVLLHMLEQKDIFVSTGSACSSNKKGQSHVLKAAGLTDEEIEGAVRFSFSRFNTVEEMDYVIANLKKSVDDIRKVIRR
ncbi:MAG: cysteine desulfurase family protein [Bacillota bacterium]|nr:cysteine desulfurase family protein [Bacillota bacterium]